jgi:hypothetical protein
MSAIAGNVDLYVRQRDIPGVSGEEEKLEIRKGKLEIGKWQFQNGNQGFETKGAAKMMKKSQSPFRCPDRSGQTPPAKMRTPLPGEASPLIV